jgi:hypothetical protein
VKHPDALLLVAIPLLSACATVLWDGGKCPPPPGTQSLVAETHVDGLEGDVNGQTMRDQPGGLESPVVGDPRRARARQERLPAVPPRLLEAPKA